MCFAVLNDNKCDESIFVNLNFVIFTRNWKPRKFYKSDLGVAYIKDTVVTPQIV